MSGGARAHGHMRSSGRLAVPLGAVACAAAFALRLPQLGSESLWYDETVSAYLAGQPLRDLLLHTSLDIHPPGYYVVLHFWSLLAGSGEYSLAYLSLWLGVLLVPLTYRTARSLMGIQAGLVAAALTAFSAFSVWYSQEVRMYTLGACLCATLLLITLRHERRPCLASALAWGATTAAALYVLYYALLLALPMSIALLIAALRRRDRRWRLRMWLLAQAAAILAYLPWLGTAVRQAVDPPVPPWRTQLGLAAMLRDGALALLGGEALAARLWPLAVLAMAIAAVGIWLGGRHRGLIALASFAVPWLALVTVSLATPLFHPRYLFPFAPGFWACLATALAALWSRGDRTPALASPSVAGSPIRAGHERQGDVALLILRRALATGAMVAYLILNGAALRAFWTEAQYRSDDLRGAVRSLAAEWCPGDVVLANAGYTYTAIAYYWPGPAPVFARLADGAQIAGKAPIVLTTGTIDGSTSLGWGDLRADFYSTSLQQETAALQSVLDDGRRLWQLRLYDTVTDPRGELREWLSSHAVLTEDRQISGPSFARLQAYAPLMTAMDCQGPTEWEGIASTCAEVGEEWSGYLPVQLWIRFGASGTAPHYSLRLIGPDGQAAVQRDGVLGGSAFAELAPGEGTVVLQPISLPAGDLPAGRYEVQLGLYTFDDGSLRTLKPSPSPDSELAMQGLMSLDFVDLGKP